MAKQLKKATYTFTSKSAAKKHDWDAYLNQEQWILVQGEDYESKNFAGSLRYQAALRGQDMKINFLTAGDPDPSNPKQTLPEGFEGLIAQAGPVDEAAGKEYREHQKELIAARKAKKAAEGTTEGDEAPETDEGPEAEINE